MGMLQQLMDERRALMPEGTNAYRLSDGREWKNIFIDQLADRILVSTRDRYIDHALMNELEDSGLSIYSKALDRDVKQAPDHLAGPEAPLRFEIMENGVRYWMDLAAGYSQGIFLDQRENRLCVRELVKPGMKVLNTFAYTGAFSICAALAGAETTTLDLTQPCLDWAKENFLLNGVDPETQFFCKGDTMHWLGRFAKQGKRFDGIILDPPTFSRDRDGKVFRVETHFGQLAARAASCLTPNGWLLCSTNCRKLSSIDFELMLADAVPNAKLVSVPMPPDFDGEEYLKAVWVHLNP